MVKIVTFVFRQTDRLTDRQTDSSVDLVCGEMR